MGDTFIRHIALLGFEKRFVPSQHYVSNRGALRAHGDKPVAGAQVPDGAVPARLPGPLARRGAQWMCAPDTDARPGSPGPSVGGQASWPLAPACRPHSLLPRPSQESAVRALFASCSRPGSPAHLCRAHSSRKPFLTIPVFRELSSKEGGLAANLCHPQPAVGSVT